MHTLYLIFTAGTLTYCLHTFLLDYQLKDKSFYINKEDLNFLVTIKLLGVQKKKEDKYYCEEDYQALQDDLSHLHDWSVLGLAMFNPIEKHQEPVTCVI